jgi:cation transport ATPase
VAQLAWYERIHPFGERFVRTALRTIAIAFVAFAFGWATRWLPTAFQLPVQVALLLITLWCSLRLALPMGDRQSLGKLGRGLRLVPSAA